MRLAHHHAVGGTVDQAANKFAELVNAKTKAAIQVKVFPAAQLGQEREAYGLATPASSICRSLLSPSSIRSTPRST